MKTPLLLAALLALTAAAAPETRMTVSLPAGLPADGGRLLVFVAPATAANAKADEVDTAEFGGTAGVSVAARDVAGFGADRTVSIDTQALAYPKGFAALAPGDYRVQAVLDRNGNYGYAGRGAGDLVSKVVTLRLPAAQPPVLALDHALPARDPMDFSAAPKDTQARIAAARPHLTEVMFPSPSLSAFWGRPVAIPVWVLAPPGYDPKAKQTWPTVFTTGGFGTSHRSDVGGAARIWEQEAAGTMPPMLWVFLDHSAIGTGTTEFADSVNNGPWGHALTTELIPALERRFRMDARPQGRFLTGHSSGGWATLWLQVAYPTIFGGAWPTSPDPSDFHDFTGVDLYAPGANMYRDAAGKPRPLVRDKGQVVATIESFGRIEPVLARDGGQLASFDWVFSPRGRDGRPMPMFDAQTGAIDPQVVAYWRDHYDVAHKVETSDAAYRRALAGKVHLTVGTADTFYLDGSARLLDAAMRRAGVAADFTYLPGKTHGDLYERGGDTQALAKDITWAMIAVARPGTKRPAEASPAVK